MCRMTIFFFPWIACCKQVSSLRPNHTITSGLVSTKDQLLPLFVIDILGHLPGSVHYIFVFFSWKTDPCGFSNLLLSRFSRLLCCWSVLRGTFHCVGRLIVFAHCQLIRNEQQLFLCILFHWKVEHQYGISQNTSGLNSLTAVALEDLIKPYYKVSLVIIMNNIEIIIGIIRVNQALL